MIRIGVLAVFFLAISAFAADVSTEVTYSRDRGRELGETGSQVPGVAADEAYCPV